ncbi:MAG: hypothetical protein NPINA01_30090 [Nitrospinaceae bacterium]|nr:MAG: hypothetical protein NPINA01_30090 [Nitrospinaceae bacterium]
MKSENCAKNNWWLAFSLVLIVLTGCINTAQLVVNEEAEVKSYSDLYFIGPEEDPREIVPIVMEKFKELGFNIKIVNQDEPLSGQGTGFVISRRGYIITCAHVMGEQRDATIWIAGQRYEADVISANKEKDLAVLKTRTSLNPQINPLSFRINPEPKMGENVYTIGFPMSHLLGDSARLSKGLINATKGLKDDPNQVQISTEVQPGNSGGPLFDDNGVVLGIIQQTLAPSKVFNQSGGLPQNVNFAIRSKVVLDYIKAENNNLYQEILFGQNRSIADIEGSAAKIMTGIIPEGSEKIPKLIAVLDYKSIWDLWFKFKYFTIAFYDFNSREPLFAAGQGYLNINSTLNSVIEDTFDHIRKALKKNLINKKNISE